MHAILATAATDFLAMSEAELRQHIAAADAEGLDALEARGHLAYRDGEHLRDAPRCRNDERFVDEDFERGWVAENRRANAAFLARNQEPLFRRSKGA